MKVINTIYTELDIEDINFVDRSETYGDDKIFYETLKASIQKDGVLDPIFAFNNINTNGVSKLTGVGIRNIVGNNRCYVCKELGIKKIPAIVTQRDFYDDCHVTSGKLLQGEELISDEDVKKHFCVPHLVAVRRNEGGWIEQAQAGQFRKNYADWQKPAV